MNRMLLPLVCLPVILSAGCMSTPGVALPDTPPPMPLTKTALVTLNRDGIRAVARRAAEQAMPGLDLAAFMPGYVICMSRPETDPAVLVIVEWLGSEAVQLEKGETADTDRKKVRKIRVRMSATGEILGVNETFVWLQRKGSGPVQE